MSDTIGTLTDKLVTVSLKIGNVFDKLIQTDKAMWDQQEHIFEIRRMSLEEFKERYWSQPDGAEKLYNYLKNACDLNLQRNQLMNEIDQKLIEMIDSRISGENLDNGKFIQRAHKTY